MKLWRYHFKGVEGYETILMVSLITGFSVEADELVGDVDCGVTSPVMLADSGCSNNCLSENMM